MHIIRSLTLFGVLHFACKDLMDEYISLRGTKLEIGRGGEGIYIIVSHVENGVITCPPYVILQ